MKEILRVYMRDHKMLLILRNGWIRISIGLQSDLEAVLCADNVRTVEERWPSDAVVADV